MTSHFNDPKIQRAIENAGAIMLPKFLIPFIEFRSEGSKSEACITKSSFRLALIDDDQMIREHWEDKAKESGLAIYAVADFSALDASRISLSTPIYIDLNLKGVSGLSVAQTLHEKGYEHLYFSTGSVLNKSQVPDYIRGIINKEFPTLFEVQV